MILPLYTHQTSPAWYSLYALIKHHLHDTPFMHSSSISCMILPLYTHQASPAWYSLYTLIKHHLHDTPWLLEPMLCVGGNEQRQWESAPGRTGSPGLLHDMVKPSVPPQNPCPADLYLGQDKSAYHIPSPTADLDQDWPPSCRLTTVFSNYCNDVIIIIVLNLY